MRSCSKTGIAAAVVFAACCAAPGSGSAQTLTETLSVAYRTNPQLLAERARQRATDEGVARAWGGWRPTITLFTEAGRASDELRQNVPQAGNATVRQDQNRSPLNAGVQVRQSIWDGGRTAADIRRAEQTVERGIAVLTAVEHQVLLDAATVHAELVRDIQIHALTVANVEGLRTQREIVARRMLARDATRTDEAQADSRIARGIAERESADGTRRATRSAYARVVGGEPGENPRPAALPPAELLPQSIDEARRLFANNPDVRASTFAITVADAETDVAWAGLLPDIALRGTMRRLNQQDSPNLGRDTKEIVVALNIPLYEAGVAAARVRESKHTTGQRQIELDQTRRRILDSITRAWEQVAASRARIAALQQQIRAGQVAVDSLKAEVRVGSRTLTEQLDAEQDLLNARIELQRAQRDEIVGSYQLAALVGNLTAEKLRLPVEIYDPREHLERTRGRFTGTDTLVDYPPPSPPAR